MNASGQNIFTLDTNMATRGNLNKINKRLLKVFVAEQDEEVKMKKQKEY